MPRIFTGIEVPPSLSERLTGLYSGLDGARWVPPENHHITLRFVGDTDELTAEEFDSALGRISAAPFELQLSGLGSFGGRKPRAVWAAVAPTAPLDDLRKANERAARDAGIEPCSRKYTPHVTMARMRHARAPLVAKYLERHGAFLSQPFPVDRFVLYSARESIGGGPYVVERAYPLDG